MMTPPTVDNVPEVSDEDEDMAVQRLLSNDSSLQAITSIATHMHMCHFNISEENAELLESTFRRQRYPCSETRRSLARITGLGLCFVNVSNFSIIFAIEIPKVILNLPGHLFQILQVQCYSFLNMFQWFVSSITILFVFFSQNWFTRRRAQLLRIRKRLHFPCDPCVSSIQVIGTSRGD